MTQKLQNEQPIIPFPCALNFYALALKHFYDCNCWTVVLQEQGRGTRASKPDQIWQKNLNLMILLLWFAGELWYSEKPAMAEHTWVLIECCPSKFT